MGLFKIQLAKPLGQVEIGILAFYGIPREIMLLHSVITALIEVAPHHGAGFCLEFREEPLDEADGDLIGQLPAILSSGSRRIQISVIGKDQSDQVIPVSANAQIHGTIGIHFNIEVGLVLRNGAEEEFQAAVQARHGSLPLFLSADVGLPGGEVGISKIPKERFGNLLTRLYHQLIQQDLLELQMS